MSVAGFGIWENAGVKLNEWALWNGFELGNLIEEKLDEKSPEMAMNCPSVAS